MRRQDRFILNGVMWGAGITSFVDIFIQWKEHADRGEPFTWYSYDGWRTIRWAAIGGTAGGGLGYAYYCSKISEEAKKPFNSDEYVKKVLTKEHLKSNPAALNKAIAYHGKLKQWMADKFRHKLVTWPEDTGSFHKRTALASNYDLDIVLPFKRTSYATLEEMYYDVHSVIEDEFGSKAFVKKQTSTIGLTIESKSDPIHFDIVPGREINNYPSEKDLNLYVRPDWAWQRGSSFKTNVNSQKTITANKPEARVVIKLLKAYRDRNGLALPTLTIEQYVVAALSDDHFGVYASPTENLLNSMHYISKKLSQKKLIDIANSNNNLHDKVTDIQRSYTASQLKSDIKKIEENPHYMKEIFEC